MARTIKRDWLNDFLAQKGLLVSGHPTFAERLRLDADHCASLRFVHRADTVLVFLTVETPSVLGFTEDLFGLEVTRQLQALFGAAFHVLVFDTTDSFLLWNHGGYERHSSGSLQQRFAAFHPALVENVGAYKTINKTTNDNFQKWTRTCLTRNCVVNDFDALLIGEQTIVFELKRVRQGLRQWRPYLDDLNNYKSLVKMGSVFKMGQRVVAYNEFNEEEIAFHFNLDLSETQNIGGQFMLLSPECVWKPYIGQKYLSSNRRL